MSKFNVFVLGLMTFVICGCQWIATHPEAVKEAEEIAEVVGEEVIKDLAK